MGNPLSLIFSRLGINAEKTFIPHQVALEQMRKGETAAVVFITSKPVDAFVRGRWDPGFKFLPVKYESKFEDYYLPAVLEAGEYPGLIKQGERVSTIAVPTVLVAYNWQPQTNRYQRVARFVDLLFTRIDKLQAAGFDPKWKSINLAATVPGLDRFAAAQEWLDRNSSAMASVDTRRRFDQFLSENQVRAKPEDREALFRQFLEWQKSQSVAR